MRIPQLTVTYSNIGWIRFWRTREGEPNVRTEIRHGGMAFDLTERCESWDDVNREFAPSEGGFGIASAMRGVGSEPHLVGVVGGDDDGGGEHVSYRNGGAGAVPAMHLNAAVGHGDAGGAIMVGGGDVDPLGCALGRDESRVVDAVGMFVDEEKGLGGARQGEVAEFSDVTIVGSVDGRGLGIAGADEEVHGDAADANLAGALLDRAHVGVGWAFVDVGFALDVWADGALNRVFDAGDVCVVAGGVPCEPAAGPGACGGRLGGHAAAAVDGAGEDVVVIGGKGEPAAGEFLFAGEAFDDARSNLAARKSGKGKAEEQDDGRGDGDEIETGESLFVWLVWIARFHVNRALSKL